jgi:hypothetical protein
LELVKGAFFSGSAIHFFKSPNLQNNLKFKIQDSFLEYFFFEIGRFEKRIALSEEKPPLGHDLMAFI